jgi:hypothetical protein
MNRYMVVNNNLILRPLDGNLCLYSDVEKMAQDYKDLAKESARLMEVVDEIMKELYAYKDLVEKLEG